MTLSNFQPSLADFERAAQAIADDAIQSPLLRLHTAAASEIRLKAENLQPLGSFKIPIEQASKVVMSKVRNKK